MAPNVQKDHLWKPPGTQVGPKVAQVPSRAPFLSDFEVRFGGIWVGGCVFLVWFRVAFVAKTEQKMNYHCTPKSINLGLHLTMSVFLLAASLNFKMYWRELLSFPVLANTGIPESSGSPRS